MGDYGSAVSLKGYDVKTCADRFLVYSSAFQNLKVYNVYSVSTTVPSSGTNTITITHNLGYYAPFIIVYNGSSGRGVSNSFYFGGGLDYGLPLNGAVTNRQYTNSLQIDVPNGFDSSGTSTGNTVYFTVYVFLDDFSTISGTTINTGTTSGGSSTDYGIRISKPGYDVKTCADIDCILSSSFYSQVIHKKGTLTGVGATVSHGLGYIPDYLCYIKSSGDSYIQYSPLLTHINSSVLTPGLYSGDTAYYVIFKDRLI